MPGAEGAVAAATYDWRPANRWENYNIKSRSALRSQDLPRGRGKRHARRVRCQNLQSDLLGVLRLNPAPQVIRQRGIHPVATGA